MAVRNLYIESRDLLFKGSSIWAGSRMYRGDDIYLLDFWPLDNLNTVGAGVKGEIEKRTQIAIHGGLNQPNSSFYTQTAARPLVFNQFGAVDVPVLDRQRFIGSARVQHILPVSADGAGLKGVLYAEMHRLPAGQREAKPGTFEALPADSGFVIGAQLGAFSGQRDTHVNLFLRYAQGIAAYGELATPSELSIDRTTSGAHELLVAVGANYEYGPVGVMAGGYFRSFRNASPDLDFNDVDEGIFAVRPHVFFGELGGLAVEGSSQAQQRGVRIPEGVDGAQRDATGALGARLIRFGIIPFLSPAGRGDYSRPQFRMIYAVTLRNDAARALYPQDDVFSIRKTEHFFGIGAEWWFNSSSYGG
jgi:maltoporin